MMARDESRRPFLPGADLIERGRDLERGIESIEALLVSIGAPRLPSPLDFIAVPPGWEERSVSFERIEPELYRFPAIHPPAFRRRVEHLFPEATSPRLDR
ncbi:MAG: hypothetical protein NZL88_08780 [Gaiellaceae bacterium]|nr:hypothetical protein [Gaiellaceae bacterium]